MPKRITSASEQLPPQSTTCPGKTRINKHHAHPSGFSQSSSGSFWISVMLLGWASFSVFNGLAKRLTETKAVLKLCHLFVNWLHFTILTTSIIITETVFKLCAITHADCKIFDVKVIKLWKIWLKWCLWDGKKICWFAKSPQVLDISLVLKGIERR